MACDNKFRGKNSTMWIYGTHTVLASLKNNNRKVLRLCVLQSVLDDFSNVKNGVIPEIVDKNFFASKFGKDTVHQGCAALVQELKQVTIEDILNDNADSPIIILDQITDPHNIGAILRSSAAFGASCVIVPDNNMPEITGSLAKAACGALEIVPIIRVINLSSTIKLLQKNLFWIIGLDESGDKLLSEIDLKGKFAFIIGSEGDGMRRLTRESCDILCKLPVNSNFTTLNAAQACSITLYESHRQRCIKI